MPFSDTATRTGLIQHCERLTNLGNGSISGDEGLLAEFTAELNLAFDEVLPLILASDRKWQWDDANYTDLPIGTINIVSGRADYNFIEDDNGASVLEIDRVYIKKTPTGDYELLPAVDASTGERPAALAGNASNSGVPTAYDKLATAIILDPIPNYSASAGLKVVFRRTPSYFDPEDTTKTPGIPRFSHQLLSLIASRNWLTVHKTEAVSLIVEVKEQIRDKKSDLSLHLNRRSRDERIVARARTESSR